MFLTFVTAFTSILEGQQSGLPLDVKKSEEIGPDFASYLVKNNFQDTSIESNLTQVIHTPLNTQIYSQENLEMKDTEPLIATDLPLELASIPRIVKEFFNLKAENNQQNTFIEKKQFLENPEQKEQKSNLYNKLALEMPSVTTPSIIQKIDSSMTIVLEENCTENNDFDVLNELPVNLDKKILPTDIQNQPLEYFLIDKKYPLNNHFDQKQKLEEDQNSDSNNYSFQKDKIFLQTQTDIVPGNIFDKAPVENRNFFPFIEKITGIEADSVKKLSELPTFETKAPLQVLSLQAQNIPDTEIKPSFLTLDEISLVEQGIPTKQDFASKHLIQQKKILPLSIEFPKTNAFSEISDPLILSTVPITEFEPLLDAKPEALINLEKSNSSLDFLKTPVSFVSQTISSLIPNSQLDLQKSVFQVPNALVPQEEASNLKVPSIRNANLQMLKDQRPLLQIHKQHPYLSATTDLKGKISDSELFVTKFLNQSTLTEGTDYQPIEHPMYFTPAGGSMVLPIRSENPFIITEAKNVENLIHTTISNLNEGKKSIQFQLEPEHLGKIEIALEMSANQQLTLHFTTDTSISSYLLEKNITQLEQALVNVGYKFASITIDNQQALSLPNGADFTSSSHQQNSENAAQKFKSFAKKASSLIIAEDPTELIDLSPYGLLSINQLL